MDKDYWRTQYSRSVIYINKTHFPSVSLSKTKTLHIWQFSNKLVRLVSDIDPDETLREALWGYSHSSDLSTKSIRNLYVLQDSRKRHEGKLESCLSFQCWILLKLSKKLHKMLWSNLPKTTGLSGISMSSKTPGRDLDDRWSLDIVPDVRSW